MASSLTLVAALALQPANAPGSDFTFPFAPFDAVTRMEARPGGEVSCEVIVAGRSVSLRDRDECGFLAGTGAADALRRMGVGAQLTQFLEIALGDGAEHRRDAPPGEELVIDSEASVSVSPDGRIADCRLTKNLALRALDGLRAGPPLCTYRSRRAHVFAPASGEAEPRRARIRSLVYLRPATP